MSQGHPARWTQITALVLEVIFEDIVSAVIFPELKSTSQKIGLAPTFITDEADEI